MARPQVFVSSTYYDLRYLRSSLDEFIRTIGYEPVLFEKGNIPFHHHLLLEESCAREVDSADIFVLIVGGRYGSLSREDEEARNQDSEGFFQKVRSVTRKEYERARDRELPIYIFVESAVLAEYRTFEKNRDNNEIKYAHVDDVRIFHLVDDIFSQELAISLKASRRPMKSQAG